MGAKSILDILIRTSYDGKKMTGATQSLVGFKNAIGSVVPVFAAFAGAAYTVDKVLDATVGRFVEYAGEVEKAKIMTGASAEETSRIIQATDDLGISYDSLMKSLKAANDEGYQPNIEGLATLSDQFLAIEDPVERVNFLMDTFGSKTGPEMAKFMQLGGQGIRDLTASIDDSLIVTEDGIQQAQAYKFALDTWGDSVEALKLDIGMGLLPAVTKMSIGLAESGNIRKEANRLMQEGIAHNREEALTMAAAAVQTEYMNRALLEQTTALEEVGQTAEEQMEHYGNLLNLTLDLQDGYDQFNEKAGEVNAKMRDLNLAFQAGEVTAEEYESQMAGLTGELKENEQAAELWAKKFVFSMAQARLAASGGGIDSQEFGFLIELGENMGLIDEKTATMAETINQKMDSLDTSVAQGEADDFATSWQTLLDMPADKTFTVNFVQNGGDYNDDLIGPNNYAIGGPFEAGQPMRVHQDEILVPSYDGVVLTRTDAMQLMQGGGGRGNKNITINGGLTIVAQGSVMDVLDELS